METKVTENEISESVVGEDWHIIGDVDEPAFENSWVNFGGVYHTARFKKANNVVYLDGLVKSGTSSSIIFTLPEEYRPIADSLVITSMDIGSGATIGNLHIYSDGRIQMAVAGTYTWISIHIQFVVN
jgi:hypothetical protein